MMGGPCIFGIGCHFLDRQTRRMKNFSKTTGVIGVTLLVCLGQVSQSRAAAVLFDNLGQPGGGFSSTFPVSLAQAFTTTSTDFVLSEVSLPLWRRAGAAGTYEILVWDSTGDGGSPGAQVGSAIHTGLAENLSTTGGSYVVGWMIGWFEGRSGWWVCLCGLKRHRRDQRLSSCWVE